MSGKGKINIPRKDRCVVDRITEPSGIVIFGASGDLTRRKLLPALFNLFKNRLLPESFFILGAARTDFDDRRFKTSIKDETKTGKGLLQDFLSHIYYCPIDYPDAAGYKKLRNKLNSLERKHNTGSRRLFYLAVPPMLSEGIVEGIGLNGLITPGGYNRIVVEKPFGWDIPSAKRLNSTLMRYFKEEEVFRIDHYLGKETVQDILLFRFANSIFEPVWNRNHIDHVQITAAERTGIGARAGYYDSIGIIRDMFQNHIIQLLGLVAMEPPVLFESNRIREEKVKVFRSLRPLTTTDISENAVFGQYISGVLDGEAAPGYRKEKGVKPGSNTPTFAAMRVFIDNWRWQGVPFYLCSGKRLRSTITEVSVHFKTVPHSIFKGVISDEIKPNVLVFRIHPDESIELVFQTKMPGTKLCLRDVTMDFSYKTIDTLPLPDAYERVIMDCLRGDHLLFVGQEGVELAWEFFTPVLDFLEGTKKPESFINRYKIGTYGPKKADELIQKDGRQWWVR